MVQYIICVCVKKKEDSIICVVIIFHPPFVTTLSKLKYMRFVHIGILLTKHNSLLNFCCLFPLLSTTPTRINTQSIGFGSTKKGTCMTTKGENSMASPEGHGSRH